MSGSKNLTSFPYRFFHFRGPPSLRLAFDATQSNEEFGRIQCQRSKKSSCRRKRKREVFLCRRAVRVKANGKVITASVLKIFCSSVQTTVCLAARAEKKGRSIELKAIQNPSSKPLPRNKRGQVRKKQRRFQ